MHPNLKRLSHSAQILEETCPRLFQLDRLSVREQDAKDVHTDFGHLVGYMVQQYLISGDRDVAIFAAFMTYPRDLFTDDEEEVAKEERSKKNFFFAIHALDKFILFKEESLSGYNLVTFNDAPAVELGYTINCDNGFMYRGKLDALLENKAGAFACLEVKTTAARNIHAAMFRNSSQGLGYSSLIDLIAAKLGRQQRDSFPIFYPLYSTMKMEWIDFHFTKTRTSHANWIRHLLRTIQHVSEYAEDDFFPMHGQSCFHYNRPCKFFELCEMRTENIVGKIEKVIVKKDEEEEYTFHFSLDELIQAQIEKQLVTT